MTGERFSLEVEAQLDRWPVKQRPLFRELLEDAATPLQRELLTRALLAAHSPAELHAFADAIRELDDEATYRACTVGDAAPEGHTVAQLLRAEADPLYAYELMGGQLDPADDEMPSSAATFTELPLVSALPAARSSAPRPVVFQADSHASLPPVLSKDWGELGMSAPATSAARLGAVSLKLVEDFLAEATRPLGLGWREVDLDVPGGLSLLEGLATAAGALARGIPVPCVLGREVGQLQRLVVMLQASAGTRSRAFELYDPFSGEVVWANEVDLLAARELPFENKALRRLTRLVLPQTAAR